MTASTPPDLNTKMTERARTVWSLGDFARAGAEQVIVGELLARAIDIHPGERATDFVPTLLETAARRAQVEGLELETREADAQDLPFPDATFDVVLSTFGVIFAPDQSRAAAELLRVCRPGGRIGLTAWTPDSVMAAIQAIAAQYAPPRPGARSPIEWGTEARVRELLGDGVTGLTAQVLSTDMCGISPAARVEFNRTYVGPTKALFDRLGPDAQQALAAELASCLDRFNRATDGTLVAPADYLQVVATRTAG